MKTSRIKYNPFFQYTPKEQENNRKFHSQEVHNQMYIGMPRSKKTILGRAKSFLQRQARKLTRPTY